MQVLKNVKAYVDGEIVKCDIAFENGVIKEIGKNLDTYKAKEISVDKYSVVCSESVPSRTFKSPFFTLMI